MTAPDWWRGAVVYQVYPRSFADGDGDGVGDLAGAAARLGHVAELGADAVWIAPFFRSPQADFGYDVSDHRDVDPMFGTLADFDALVGEAHRLGLRVLVDFIPGHTSSEHRWFEDSRAGRDGAHAHWYVWADPKPDGTPPNNWLSFFGGSAWQWEPRRGQYYLHHFHRAQPNLDLTVPEVVEAQLDVAAFWLERGVDGLRLDAVPMAGHDPLLRDNPVRGPASGGAVEVSGNAMNPIFRQRFDRSFDAPHLMDFLARLRTRADAVRPDVFLMGEVDNVDAVAVGAKYTRSGRHLHSCYHFGLLQPTLTGASARAAIARTHAAQANGGCTTWATGNHDVVRLASRYAPLGDAALERARHRTVLALFPSLEGGACLYQGDELGLTEAVLARHELRDPTGIEFWPDYAGRDGCRTPMPWEADAPGMGFTDATPWLPLPGAHRALAASVQADDPDSTLRFVQGFLGWRRTRAELVRGTLEPVELDGTDGAAGAGGTVVAFDRVLDGARTRCLFNLGRASARCRVGARARTLAGHGLEGGADASGGDAVTLRPFGAWFGEIGTG